MTRIQRIARFLSYFWINMGIFTGFYIAFIAFPVFFIPWHEYSGWFWWASGVYALAVTITIIQYIRYIRFGK